MRAVTTTMTVVKFRLTLDDALERFQFLGGYHGFNNKLKKVLEKVIFCHFCC